MVDEIERISAEKSALIRAHAWRDSDDHKGSPASKGSYALRHRRGGPNKVDTGVKLTIRCLDEVGLPGVRCGINNNVDIECMQATKFDGITLDSLQAKFPDQDATELNKTLAELFKNGWVISLGEPPNVHYKINLRRKRGASFNGVWSNIMDRLAQKPSDKRWDFKF